RATTRRSSPAAATSPATSTTTEGAMPVSDLRRTVRYLLVALVAYALIALGSGHGIQPVELVVFLLGIAALLVASARLQDT
ncbi:MAG: hypothetical protein ACOC42_04330, partial [Halobacteriota archaeon]